MAEDRRRLYSDEETGALILRASERQRIADDVTDRGLSLQAIESIAAELGIEASHVRAAAREGHGRSDAAPRFRLWGGPFVLDEHRSADGPLTEEVWHRIVRELRRVTGSAGDVREIGRAREWSRTSKDLDVVVERTHVSVSPEEGQVVIELRKQFQGGAIITYVVGALLSGGAAGIFLDGGGWSELTTALVAGGSGVGGLVLARASIAYWTKRQKEKLRSLANWLQETVSATGPPDRTEETDARRTLTLTSPESVASSGPSPLPRTGDGARP